jgi:hypothetical protein
MNNIDNSLYSITDEQLQVAHQIAKILVKEQKRIKPDETGKGIISELSKLITYLDYKIKQNTNLSPKQKRKPTKFFVYLEKLAEHSNTIGHSGKTPDYHKTLNETCKKYLKEYVKKPQEIIQILAWTQRLMHYYKNFNISDLDVSEAPKFVKPVVEQTSQTPKSPQKLQSPKPLSPQPIKQTRTDNSHSLKHPTPPKATKPVENSPKLETPKAPEPPNPFKRPSKDK